MSHRKPYKISSETMIATADISKDSFSGYFRIANDGPDCGIFFNGNDFHGLNEYYRRMREFSKKHGVTQIIIGFESTGVYHVPFMQFFHDKPVLLMQVNTMHVKRMKDITDNSSAKTDNKDPRVIADIVEMRHALRVVIPTGDMAEMRRLIHARERAMEHLTAISNQLSDVVYTLFPEFSRVIKNIRSRTAYQLLRMYPTPQAILTLGIDTLAIFIRKASRGRFGKVEANLLYAAAQCSLGASHGREGLVMEISMLIDLVEQFEKAIISYENTLEKLVKQVPEGQYLLSIKGIGPTTIAGILGEYDGFKPFETIAEVLKYAGMNFTENSSGRRHGKRRLSKRGRGLVRKLVYYAALNTIKKGRVFHDVYQNHLKKGMPKTKALMAVAQKIIRTLFAMAKNLSYFDAHYHLNYKQAA